METFPEDTFEMVKARIVDGSDGGESGWGGGDHGIAVFGWERLGNPGK